MGDGSKVTEATTKNWRTQDGRKAIIARARKLWEENYPFQGWDMDQRDYFVIRAAIEFAAENGVTPTPPPHVAEIVSPGSASGNGPDMKTLRSIGTDILDYPVGTKFYTHPTAPVPNKTWPPEQQLLEAARLGLAKLTELGYEHCPAANCLRSALGQSAKI